MFFKHDGISGDKGHISDCNSCFVPVTELKVQKLIYIACRGD